MKDLLEGYKLENEQLMLKIAQQATAIKSLQNRLNESVDMIKLRELENSVNHFKALAESLKSENELLVEKLTIAQDRLERERSKTFIQRLFNR